MLSLLALCLLEHFRAALNGESEVGAVENGDEIAVLVRVFNQNLVRRVDLTFEDALHHQHELVVSYILIVNGNAPYVLAQADFDQQFPRQVHDGRLGGSLIIFDQRGVYTLLIRRASAFSNRRFHWYSVGMLR